MSQEGGCRRQNGRRCIEGPWTAIGGMRDWHYFGRGMRDMPFFIGGMRDGKFWRDAIFGVFTRRDAGLGIFQRRDKGWENIGGMRDDLYPYTYDNTNILLWLKVDRNHHYIRLYLLSSNRNQAITPCTAKIHRNIIFFICRKAKKFG